MTVPHLAQGHTRAHWWRLITQTLEELAQARADLLACALAFRCLLSIAPPLIVAVALAGVVLGRGKALAQVARMLTSTLGAGRGGAVLEWVQQASKRAEAASFVGIALMAWSASRLGSGLRDAFNQLWAIDVVVSRGVRSSISDYLRHRLSAFLIVAAAAPLLLVVFASRAPLTAFHGALFASSPGGGIAIQLLHIAGSFSVVALISAMVFRYEPDTRTSWKNAVAGGVLTSMLFNGGNALVGLYLGVASFSAAYGAAGSAVVVLLWLYYSAYTFLIGGKFTHVYAHQARRWSCELAQWSEWFALESKPPELEQPSSVADTIQVCRAIQADRDIPITCNTDRLNGVETMIVGFSNSDDAERYMTGIVENVAGPFCSAANRASRRAALIIALANAVARHFDCEQQRWGEWFQLSQPGQTLH